MTLAEYLAKTRQTAYAFFTANELPRTAVYRAEKGKPVNVTSAKRISAATGGEVGILDLLG